MATDMEPVVGNWYYNADSDRSFEITGFQPDEGAYAVRYDDGAAGLIAVDAWYEQTLEPGAPPMIWDDDDEEDDAEELRAKRGRGHGPGGGHPRRAGGPDDDY